MVAPLLRTVASGLSTSQGRAWERPWRLCSAYLQQQQTWRIQGGNSMQRRYYEHIPGYNPSLQAEAERLAKLDEVVDRRIYFLGWGAIGKLIAHSFTDIAEAPPITLLFRDRNIQRQWIANGSTLEVIRNGVSDYHTGFEAGRVGISEDTPIQNLILATKAIHVVPTLNSVKHRLGPDSTIVFIQNGMGWLEEVNEKVFPDIETRPNYIIGIVSHGAVERSAFTTEHLGMGNIAMTALAKQPFEGEHQLKSPVTLLPPSTRYLMRTFTRTPLLGAMPVRPQVLLQIQLEKLVNNCVINPVTAILDCLNGDILKSPAENIVRLLLAEISLVIRAMPELQSVRGIKDRFRPEALERNIADLIAITAKNRSSMLQDVARGRRTEIDYLNGYIFRRGEELGIRCMVNYTIISLIKAKSLMHYQGYETVVPVASNEAELGAIDNDPK